MSDAFSIAVSGMRAASTRLQVAANNIANAGSSGPLPSAQGQAATYPPAYVAERVDQVDLSGNGTRATVVPVSPSYVPTYDPTAPFADDKGMVAAPNVDIANEIVQTIIAQYSFAANAFVVRVQAKMMKSLMDITT